MVPAQQVGEAAVVEYLQTTGIEVLLALVVAGAVSGVVAVAVRKRRRGARAALPPRCRHRLTAMAMVTASGMAGGLSSPDGNTRRSGGGGGRSSSALADIVSPPPSGSVGTDVRAAAGGGGGDESLLDEGGSPSAGGDGGGGGGGGGGGLFDVEGDTDVGVGGTSFPPTLDMEGYETTPPMSELVAMDENSLRSVTGFKVSRPGYGSIEWKEPVDLRRVDIGLVVSSYGLCYSFLVCTWKGWDCIRCEPTRLTSGIESGTGGGLS